MASELSWRARGFRCGLVGGVAGVLAMNAYWETIAPLVTRALQSQPRLSKPPQPDDSLAVAGKQYQADESSTAALGRAVYQRVAGHAPESQQTKSLLSNLVHWTYGLLQGGVYGATRADAGLFDLQGAITFASGLWLFGDEVAVPVLGLQSGPAAASPAQHLNRWGAHLAYGLATALATQLLLRLP